MKKLILITIVISLVVPNLSAVKDFDAYIGPFLAGIIYAGFSYFISPQIEPLSKEELTYEKLSCIMNSNELNDYETLYTKKQRERYLKKFWKFKDYITATKENEYKQIIDARFDYAYDNFQNQFKRLDDQGRIFVKYGQPSEVIQENFSYLRKIDRYKNVYSYEIWYYDIPAERTDNTYFSDLVGERAAFVFADVKNTGIYEQLYSNLDEEKIDPRIILDTFRKYIPTD